jgi:hypothetical protein
MIPAFRLCRRMASPIISSTSSLVTYSHPSITQPQKLTQHTHTRLAPYPVTVTSGSAAPVTIKLFLLHFLMTKMGANSPPGDVTLDETVSIIE